MTRRISMLALTILLLSGCSAMLLGGSGGYQPPADECSDEGDAENRCQS